MSESRILGLDNIEVDLPVASVGSRVLAAMIDYLLLGVVLFGASIGFFVLMGVLGVQRPGWMIAGWLILMFLLEWGYFMGQEVGMRGRTLGKRVVRLRVVAHDGSAASTGSLVLRNLLRLPDILIGVLLIATDTLGRRLGDRFAGTLVVHERPRARRRGLGRVPPGWSAREIAVAEAFVERLPQLEPFQRVTLARRLLALIERSAPELLDEARRPGVVEDPDELLLRVLRVEGH
ncbi:MAG: RDD family protein [Thermoanaerobaculia bacterium]